MFSCIALLNSNNLKIIKYIYIAYDIYIVIIEIVYNFK